MKKTIIGVLISAFIAVPMAGPAPQLNIYHIDVEGGAATLIVTPAGESILIDAGWPGFDGRDPRRIKQVLDQAGVKAIDHMVLTHYHQDHYGGIPELAKLVPIRQFYDHGTIGPEAQDRNFRTLYPAYRAAAHDQTIALKPGDEIRLRKAPGTPALKLRCLAGSGKVIGGKGPNNPECAKATPPKEEDKSDNAGSLAFLLTYGDFEFLDSGDLTWNVEQQLVCPTDRIGKVDLYQVSHHGLNTSNNPVLLRSIRPAVAIMNNGPRKGGHPDAVRWLRELPSLQALYQIHRNVTTTVEENAPEEFIANPEEQPDSGFPITVSVDAKARTMSVTNTRTGQTKTYPVP